MYFHIPPPQQKLLCLNIYIYLLLHFKTTSPLYFYTICLFYSIFYFLLTFLNKFTMRSASQTNSNNNISLKGKFNKKSKFIFYLKNCFKASHPLNGSVYLRIRLWLLSALILHRRWMQDQRALPHFWSRNLWNTIHFTHKQCWNVNRSKWRCPPGPLHRPYYAKKSPSQFALCYRYGVWRFSRQYSQCMLVETPHNKAAGHQLWHQLANFTLSVLRCDARSNLPLFHARDSCVYSDDCGDGLCIFEIL